MANRDDLGGPGRQPTTPSGPPGSPDRANPTVPPRTTTPPPGTLPTSPAGGPGVVGATGVTPSPGTTGTRTTTPAGPGPVRTQGGEDRTERAKQEARGRMEEAKEKTREEAGRLKQDAKHEGSRLVRQGRQAVSDVVYRRKDEAASRIDHFSTALREASDRLRQEDEAGVGRYAERLADQMDRLSGYLRERDINRMVNDAEDFARNRPEVFLSASFLAGVMAARFLRASSPERQTGGTRRSTWEEPGLEGTRPYGEYGARTYNPPGVREDLHVGTTPTTPTTPTRTETTPPPAPGVRTP